jgi:hypothetical protein
MVVTAGSIIGYVALSVTVNALPPLRVFPGWVAALEPVSEIGSGEQVSLTVQSDAIGSHPLVSYTLVACGPHRYVADLLIGGSAQLTNIGRFPAQFAALMPPLQVQRLPDLVLEYGVPASYGPVQLIHVSLPQVGCQSASASQETTALSGAALGIEGYAAAPFQQSWTGPWGLWHGPHATQDWPLTGALPQTTAHGVFTGLAGLSGQWIRPDADIEVSVLNPSLDQSIDSAIPAPSDPEIASWSGTDGMNPVARLTSTSSVALLQDWIVVFAVGLGIGGGMLASLLFEWLRPRRETSHHASTPAHPSGVTPSAVTEGWPSHRGTLVAAAFVVGWVCARRFRHWQ